MASSVEDVQLILAEFYSTADQQKRDQLHERLLAIQSSVASYECVCALLDIQRPAYCQHFGANVLHEFLMRHWDDFVELQRIDHVRLVLTGSLRVERASFVANKLCSALAVLMLRTMPDIWPSPITDLISEWSASHPSTLLQVLGELPFQFRRLSFVVQQRGIVKAELHKNASAVAHLAAAALDTSTSTEIALAAVCAVSHWLDMPGTDLKDWQTVVILCLHQIQRPDCQESVAKFLTRLAEHEQLDRLTNFVSDLLQFTVNFVKPILISHLEQADVADDDLLLALTRAIVTLAENQTRFIVAEIIKNAREGAGTCYIDSLLSLMLFVVGVPGFFPVDECISELPLNFWNALQADAVYEDNKAKEQQIRPRALVLPYYTELLLKLISKLSWPVPQVFAEWSAESREQFAKYRVSIGDALCSCYRVIGTDAGVSMLNALEEARKTGDSVAMEALLFAFESVADWLTSQDPSFEPLVLAVLPRMPLASDVRLTSGACRLLDRLTHLIVTSDQRRQLYPTAVGLVLPFLKTPHNSLAATSALEHLTQDRVEETELISQTVINGCYDAFCSDQLPSPERLRALRCLGYVLSTESVDTVLQSLDQLLVPRLNRLQALCSGVGQTEITEEQLLFELDIVTRLVGSLERPFRLKSVSEQRSPVFLVLEQSVPLFQSLLSLSGGNVNVARKVLDALRQGLVSLSDDASALVSSYCQLLSQLYRVDPSAFPVAKTLYLFFAKHPDHCGLLGQTLTRWSSEVFALAAEPERNADVPEAFLMFCQQLAKKESTFLLSNDASGSLAVMVDLAALTLETAQEPALVKQAALFLATLVGVAAESQLATKVIADRGARLVPACFARLLTEILTSSVEYLADVLFAFNKQYPAETRQCLQPFARQKPTVPLMLNEISNRRKFREVAKKINLESRRSR